MAVDLSVVIATMNNEDTLGRCLKSIFTQGQGVSMEIFVSDNSSRDCTAKMVRADFPAVILLENGGNLGFARANNKAIKLAKGRYVLLLNDDTVILDNALAKMVRFMDDNPDCGVSSCKLIYPDGRLQSSKFSYPSLFKEFFHANDWLKPLRKNRVVGVIGAILSKYFPAFECFSSCEQVREVDDVLGAFFLIRRTVIEKIGLLDEDFWMCREETDFSYRTRQAGYKIMYNPQTTVIHVGSSTARRSPEASTWYYCQNFISGNHFFRKHYSRPRQVGLKLIVIQAFCFKLAATLFKCLFNPAAFRQTKRCFVQYLDALRKVLTNSIERAM